MSNSVLCQSEGSQLATAPLSTHIGRRFLPTLHGLRGIMAFWIVIHHTSGFGFGFYNEGVYGYFAVDIFFILSGYVLTYNHFSQFRRVSVSEIGAFLQQRFWRIYPVYLVSAILAVPVFFLLHRDWPEPGRILESLAILDYWARPGIGVNGPVWSLGVEWIGYFAFPFIVLTLAQLNRAARLGLLGALPVGVAWFVATHSGVWQIITGPQPVVRMAAGFGAGCILLTFQADTPDWFTRRGDWLIMIAVAGSAAMLHFGFTLWVEPFLILLVFGTANPGRGCTYLLDNRVALFLGRISFSLYITHYLIVRAVMAVFGVPSTVMAQVMSTCALVVVTILVGWALCVAVEEPARRWWRVQGRKRASRDPVSSAP
jgi:peptidoglycan/LPS O-acetylase OafA/YrhL